MLILYFETNINRYFSLFIFQFSSGASAQAADGYCGCCYYKNTPDKVQPQTSTWCRVETVETLAN